MADEEIVDETPAEEAVAEEGEEQEAGKDPYEGLSEQELKERLSKAEKLIVKKKTTESRPITKQPDGDIPDWAKNMQASQERRDFAEEHGLTKAQTDAVFRYNGGKAPDEETLNSVPVQAMIKALGAKDRVAANTPKGRNAPVFKNKTFAEIATDSSASKDDKRGGFEAVRKKHGLA